MKKTSFILFLFLALNVSYMNITVAQDAPNDIFAADDDDLNVGGDIFTDFSEDVENSQLVEDERFYRYGRVVFFIMSLGLKTIDGKSGVA